MNDLACGKGDGLSLVQIPCILIWPWTFWEGQSRVCPLVPVTWAPRLFLGRGDQLGALVLRAKAWAGTADKHHISGPTLHVLPKGCQAQWVLELKVLRSNLAKYLFYAGGG